MQAFLSCHRLLEHIKTNRTHEFAVEAPGRHCNFSVVHDGILGSPVQLVQRQLPRFVQTDRFGAGHLGNASAAALTLAVLSVKSHF